MRREGWPVIGPAAGVLGLVGAVGALAGHPAALLPLLLAVGFCLYFFRDPERSPPPDERLVVSRADGRVVAVAEEREERVLQTPATRVSIVMSPLDVHVNRSPVSGTVAVVRHTAGKFRAAFADKASLDNERTALVLESGGGRHPPPQNAGAPPPPLLWRGGPGGPGPRRGGFGMIMFCSRVRPLLPAAVTPALPRG